MLGYLHVNSISVSLVRTLGFIDNLYLSVKVIGQFLG